MRLATILRVSPGAWMVPVMVGLLVAYVFFTITFGTREPYGTYLTARAMNALGLIVPVFAGTSAWAGARLARAGMWQSPMARNHLVVASWSILPAAVGGTVVIVATVAAVLLPQGLFIPDVTVLLPAISILLGHVALGFAIGTALPRALAIPLVVLLSFVTFVAPRIMGLAWLRHLSGTSLELCCTTDQRLSEGVAIAAVGGAAALLLAAGVLLWRRASARIYPAVILIALLASSGVAMAASPPTVRPGVARTDQAGECATHAGVTVCVWPEHVSLLQRLTAVAASSVAAWRAVGIEVPTTFREGVTDAGSDSVGRLVSMRAGGGKDGLLEVIVASLANQFPTNEDRPACADSERWPAGIAAPYLWVYLARVAGMSPRYISIYHEGRELPDTDYFPDAPRRLAVPVLPLVDQVLALPEAQQATWANRNLRALRTCGVDPPLLLR